MEGRPAEWSGLYNELVAADMVVSTTGADRPVVTLEDYQQQVAERRYQRPLFILDLAMPRDFEPGIAEELGVYLYGIDDLTEACDRNRAARAKSCRSPSGWSTRKPTASSPSRATGPAGR